MHPPGHGDAVTALGTSTPPEDLQCRVPLAGVGPRWPIAALRCVEAVAQEGAQQSRALCLVPAFTDTQGFVHHSLHCFGDSFLLRHR